MRNEIRRLISIGASDSRFRGGELDLTFFRDKSITARRGIRFSLDRVGKTLDWRGEGGGRIGRHFNEAEFPFPLCIKQNPPRSLR